MTEQVIPQSGGARTSGSGAWWQVLVIGLVLFFIGLAILIFTGNPNLIPVIVMVGNFTVPVAYVAFFYQRQHLSGLTLADLGKAFILGGLLGVFAASLLEPLFILRLTFLTAFEVGLIEELAKILAVVLVAGRVRHNSALDGLLLGAAVGMGFAAFESTGYSFVAFLASGGSLSATVSIILLRGFLAPAGHGTWTAILAAVLFRESQANHFRIDRSVLAAYIGVSILHGLWDGLPGLLAFFITRGVDLLIAQLIIGLIGLVALWRLWHESLRREMAIRELTNNPLESAAE